MMRKYNRNGIALILTLMVMVVVSAIVLTLIALVTGTSKNAGAQINDAKAFYLAEAGINKAVWYLLNTAPNGTTNGTWRTTAYPTAAGSNMSAIPTNPKEESLSEGKYTMWLIGSASTIEITSRGLVNDTLRTLRQSVVYVPVQPPGLYYAMLSGSNISFRGLDGMITGNVASGNNLFDSNIIINGTVESKNDLTYNFNIPAYLAIADHVIVGNKTFVSGQSYSGIWYVTGDVTIGDNVTINGSVITLGDVTMLNGTGIVITATAPYPAVLAGGNIDAKSTDNARIIGLFFANSSINLTTSDNAVFIGSIVSGSKITISKANNFSLTYDPTIIRNPPPFLIGYVPVSVNPVPATWGEI